MVSRKPLSQDPDFEEGEHEGDIYDEEGREELQESDEINEVEEGFVEGFEEGEHEAKCAECGSVLVDDKIIQEEIDGHSYNFCSNDCALAFEAGKKRKQGRALSL